MFKKAGIILIILIIPLFLFTSCDDDDTAGEREHAGFSSYLEVPGVTAEEIAAIEAVKEKYDELTYSVLFSTEAFYDLNGNIAGSSPLFCEWLSELFGIPFIPKIITMEDYMTSIVTREVDFMVAQATDVVFLDGFYTTEIPIATLNTRYFRLKNSLPLEVIASMRPVRYGFLQNSTHAAELEARVGRGVFETVWVNNNDEAHAMLHSGEIDAFLQTNITEALFDVYGDVKANDVFPIIPIPAVMITPNPEFTAFLSVLDKALVTEMDPYFNSLYIRGYEEYLRTKLYNKFTPEERDFIRNNPILPVLTLQDNYPVSFFNDHENEWQGIIFDIFEEINNLTGLSFEVDNPQGATYADLLEMIEGGEKHYVSNMLRIAEREEQFLWSDTPIVSDRYALISRIDFPNMNIREVPQVSVGAAQNTAYMMLFENWFPEHEEIITYNGILDKFNGLTNGEVDTVIASQNLLLMMTHYHERTGYKVNIVFDYPLESTFAFSKDDVILQSIINKTLQLIDIESISEHWTRRAFDYRRRMAEEQLPWILGVWGLSLCVLVLVTVMLVKSRQTGRRAEAIVKERTRELGEQSAMLEALVDTIPDIIFTKDTNLRFTHVNKAFLSHFGLKEKEVIGRTDADVLKIPDDLVKRFNDRDYKVINSREHHVEEEYVPHVNGSVPFFETVKVPVVIGKDSIGVMGIARDITKRKELEKKLEYNYEYAKRLSDSLVSITQSSTVFGENIKAAADIITQEGCCTLNIHRVGIWRLREEANALENISYFSVSTWKNTVIDDYIISDDPKYLNEIKSTRLLAVNSVYGTTFDKEAENVYHDELCALIEAPIRIDGNFYGLISFEQEKCEQYPKEREWTLEEQNYASSLADITALVISGAQRHKAFQAAEAANRAKSEFLAIMSHEIRTPMNSIVGFSELALDENLPVRTKDYLNKIEENAEWLLQIINDILDISKIEAGKMELEQVPFDLQKLFTSCRTAIMPRAIDKNLTLHFYAEPSVGKMPLGDPTKLRQVLINLLSNAVKFTNSGIIKLLALVTEKTNDNVTMRFEVKDSGIGMTPDQIERIFEPFIQAESGTTRKYGGTGLGLSITKNIIELMGGNLTIESILGVGSKFIFELVFDTIDVNDADLSENKIVYNKLERPHFEGEVLLCEDNIMNQQVICEHLTKVGLKTVVAENGKIGVDIIEKRVNNGMKLFDLIFMDIHMPEMDGFEASERILAVAPDIPIVALTANVMTEDRKLYKEKGMNDYVGKPFTSQELWHCLIKYFEPEIEQNGQTKEDENFNQKLFHTFINSNGDKINEIKEAVSSGDIKLAHRLAHTLKSNAALLNKTLLQKAAADVESGFTDGENLVTPEQMELLEVELNAVLTNLASMLSIHGTVPESISFLEKAEARKLLMNLLPVLEENDASCLSFVNELRRVRGSEELVKQIEGFDFKGAAGTLKELEKTL
jgi:PAS domain S-box-containing protein